MATLGSRPTIHEDAINAIAIDTSTPVETVSKMCEQTWAELSEGARITDYLSLLITRHVRESLRRQRRDTH